MGGTEPMSDDKALLPESAISSGEKKDDLDDLIFRGEGWLISDR